MKVSDAVVEAGCKAVTGDQFWRACSEDAKRAYRRSIRAALEAALPMVVGEALAAVEPMPGADRFTMACFEAEKVPSGTKLHTLTNLEDAP